MPSPEHAADLERVLTRAAEECEAGTVWFGDGLPQTLKSAMETARKVIESDHPKVAFVEVGLQSVPPRDAGRVVALGEGGLDDQAWLVRTAESSETRPARLICPVAVLDFTAKGVRVREIRHGLTAADLQARLDAPLWSGPDLKELGSH